MTIDDALKIGLEKNRSLHSSLMKVEYADAKASEVNAMRLPSLKFGGGYTRLSDVPPFSFTPPPALWAFGFTEFTLLPTILDNYAMRLTLQQPLFTGWRLSALSDAAEHSARATEAYYSKDMSELRLNIKIAYWTLYKAMEFKKVVDENVEQVKSHLKDVQNFLAQGLTTRNDELKVQVLLAEAQLRQIDATNKVQLATLALNNILGISLGTEIELLASVAQGSATHGSLDLLDLLVKKALRDRSEISAMEHQVQAGEAGVTAARAGWYPQIFLTGNYYYSRPNQRYQPLQNQFKESWDVGVGISLDVWNWGMTSHQTDQAQAQLAQAKDAQSLVQDGITLDITRSYLNLRSAQQKLEIATRGVEQAEENYRIMNKRFIGGLATTTDLLDADVALLQAKTSMTNGQVDYLLAEAQLDRALGK